MSVRRLALVVVCSTLLLTACHSTGNKYHTADLAQLELGVATFTDAATLLQANPVNRYYRPDGSYIARWAYTRSVVPDAIYFDKEIWLEFDAADRLISIDKR